MIQRNCVVFTASVFLSLIVFSIPSLIASQENSNKPSFKSSIPQSKVQNLSSVSSGDPKSAFPIPQLKNPEVIQKTAKIQIPFVANEGQTDERVKFYANTFGGTVFVTKNGEIVYSLPNNEKANTRSQGSENRCEKSGLNPKPVVINAEPSAIKNLKSGVTIKETLVGGRVREITGNGKAVTKVSYFKGNNPSQWENNISTYDVVSLGEVYNGIELRLKAYGNNVEKLFCVSPDANPNQIRVNLSGAKGLRVNDEGKLEAETELGAVKFTKPVAYQEIDGKRVKVSVEYSIQNPEASRQKQEARGKRLTSSGEKGMGRKCAYLTSNLQPAIHNLNSKIVNRKLEYGFKVASYDKTKDLIIDPLLASTYLGGTRADSCFSIALDTSGNVYVMGSTYSSDFPTTTGVYDTSYNGTYNNVSEMYDPDVFVAKLNEDLTSLLASTYLGGSKTDSGNSIVADLRGNIYVVGYTFSSDFPTTLNSFDTSYNDSYYSDTFILKLNDDLSNLLASTYLGGSSYDKGYSIAIDFSGNVFITGETSSLNFPTTIGVYDTSYNGKSYTDIFISKLNGDLSSLLASTYFGGTGNDQGNSLAIDSNGNIYIAGWTASRNFPTTEGAFDTSSGVYRGDILYQSLVENCLTLLHLLV